MPTVSIGYEPRDPFIPFHKRKQRWSALVCHRRAGKTVACVADLLDAALRCQLPEPRFAYVAPYYAQAKDVAWSYLKRMGGNIPGAEVNESELRLDLPNGGRVRLYGADNYDRMRGLYLDGIVLDEYADIDPRAWPEVIRPALSDRQGWAVFIGTPKGRNEFYKLYQQAVASDDWYSLMLRASSSGLIAPDELRDAQGMMTPEQYAQEYECSFNAAIMGAYYGRDMEAAEPRIIPIGHDRSADVFCAWDLGIGDAMALWFGQQVGKETHWLAYYENNGFGLDHYVDYVKSRPFPVHLHLLPHDAEARELQTGQSRIDFLRGRGLDCRVVPRHSVDDGISAVRMKFPQMWFNSTGENMERGLDCLRMYRAEYDDKNMTLKTRPLHDWASHGADAFRCGVMGLQQVQRVSLPKFTPQVVV